MKQLDNARDYIECFGVWTIEPEGIGLMTFDTLAQARTVASLVDDNDNDKHVLCIDRII